jgi:DNA polymerase-3 subunit epsilon
MKKNLTQHFTGSARISKKLQAETFTVTFEETGSELIAILKETQEIKANQPVYNRRKARRNPVPWGLFAIDRNGYTAFELRKTEADDHALTAFVSLQDGKNTLGKATSIFGLCRKLNDLDPDGGAPCSAYRHEKCLGACIGAETAESYNERAGKFIDRIDTQGNLVITDRGRTLGEKSAIVIENGYFKGYAFYDLNYQVKNLAVLKNILVPMQGSYENRHAIRSYLAKHQSPKIVRL